MKNERYRVKFKVGNIVEVNAGSLFDAAILAMAEQIKAGGDTEIEWITEGDNPYLYSIVIESY